MGRRKKNKTALFFIKLTAVIFGVALIALLFPWFKDNAWTIIIITGILLIIFAIVFRNTFSNKKFFGGLWRKL